MERIENAAWAMLLGGVINLPLRSVARGGLDTGNIISADLLD